jgi:hypothetical protein
MALLVHNWRIKDGTLKGSIATGPNAFANVANIVSVNVAGRKGLSIIVGNDGNEYFLTHTPERDAVLSGLPAIEPDVN